MSDGTVDVVDVLNESAGPSNIRAFMACVGRCVYLGSFHTFYWAAPSAAEKGHF